MVEPFVALVAEVRSAEESGKGIVAVVMIVFLDETNDLVGGYRSIVDDHMRWIVGHDFDLVPGQGGLKLFEFGKATGSFGNSSKSVKFFGHLFLDGVTLFEIFVISVLGISVLIYQSLHRDDGMSATQVVFVFDGDARFFNNTSKSGFPGSVTFSVPTARPWGTYPGSLHGEDIIMSEFFIGVQFGREGLEISVQSLTTFFEFMYSEGGGLEGVREGTGLHGEVHGGMRCQGFVGRNLLLDGPLKSAGQFLIQVVGQGDVSTLP